MQKTSLLAIPIFAALAACGGSGTGNLADSTLPGPAGFNDLILEAEAQAEKLETLSESTSLPTVDGVSYIGVMALAENFDTATEGYLGDFNATMNFATDNMTGTGSGFYFATLDGEGNPTGPGAPVPGSITLASGAVDTTVLLDVSGSLFLEGSVRDVTDGDAIGVFFGPTGDMFTALGSAEFDGTATTLNILVSSD